VKVFRYEYLQAFVTMVSVEETWEGMAPKGPSRAFHHCPTTPGQICRPQKLTITMHMHLLLFFFFRKATFICSSKLISTITIITQFVACVTQQLGLRIQYHARPKGIQYHPVVPIKPHQVFLFRKIIKPIDHTHSIPNFRIQSKYQQY
jgi:uncharacterized membrane protein